ncbi:MAG: glycosyltransferase family protein [Candidatus Limimorpha sp.]
MIKRVLICPLNWGLGHATRCVPIIKALTNQGCEVIIAADKAPLSFLQHVFPNLEFIKLPGFDPIYSRSNSQVLKMLASFPKAIMDFHRDHKAIRSIVRTHNIDIVISDNRFGCWSKEAHSVFITHQLNIQVPSLWRWAKPIINLFNNSYIRKYDEVWVPDLEEEPSLSGALSHPFKIDKKISYIGLLSRFSNTDVSDNSNKSTKYLFILSGPEPQRTIFENIILKQAKSVKDNIVILRAMPDSADLRKDIPCNVVMLNNADDSLFVHLIKDSENIICRGGYSSLMDMIRLNRSAFLIPTPGQTEQEYLAKLHGKQGYFKWCKQSDFKIENVSMPDISTHDKFDDDEGRINVFIENWLKLIN